MYQVVTQRLSQFIEAGLADHLCGGLIGLEKESLRVSPEGTISSQEHPPSLGSPLTHPYLTTDYSEALTEFITPPFNDHRQALDFLDELHRYTYTHLNGELLWSTSMPCVLEGGRNIPIARYGLSNAGMMKTVYRRGLGHRYGKVMQVIAGVHFNYSVPETFWPMYQSLLKDDSKPMEIISKAYFGMLRNLLRFGWVTPYLFGASPAVCKSFLGGKPTTLKDFNPSTYYAPHATSLRMGDIGYQNSKEQGTGVHICYDSPESYIATLSEAIETPCAIYEAIGVKVNGIYEQLNANILQIENEYYSTARPKQLTEGMEKPVHALERRGVRYIELRSLDVNAFHPLGIDEDQIRFLEILMLFCLLLESPPIGYGEQQEIDRNERLVAHDGRNPQLRLKRQGASISIKSWGSQICESMQPLAVWMDSQEEGSPYESALAQQVAKFDNPDLTPSARMLDEMDERGEGFFHFAQRMSLQHAEYFKRGAPDPDMKHRLDHEAEVSWQRQRQIEESDERSFDRFLADYFAQI